jgi:3-mercaptopyruvate sulfurtransferase SseA
VSVLVPAAELLAADRAGTVLLDDRWALGDDRGRQRYLEGHLPGAVFVDLETEVAAPASAAHGDVGQPAPAL